MTDKLIRVDFTEPQIDLIIGIMERLANQIEGTTPKEGLRRFAEGLKNAKMRVGINND